MYYPLFLSIEDTLPVSNESKIIMKKGVRFLVSVNNMTVPGLIFERCNILFYFSGCLTLPAETAIW